MKKTLFILYNLLAFYGYAQVIGNCNNIGFEDSTTNNWYFANGNVIGDSLPCNTCAATNGALANVVTNTSSVGSQCINGFDHYGGFPVVAPQSGGNYSLLLNNDSAGGKLQQASQNITVTASNVDFVFSFAAVLQKGNLPDSIAPFFDFYVIELSTNAIISCSRFNPNSNPNITGWQTSTINNTVNYLPWQTIGLDLAMAMGHNVKVVFTVSDGSNGTSFGYAYIDASCNPGVITPWNPTICNGDSITLHGPAGMTSYNWSGPLTASTQNITTYIPGTYTLVTTTLSNCSVPTFYSTLTLNPVPSITYTLVQDIVPHTWDVYPAYPPNVTQYSWNFGDGSPLDTSAYPSHTYAVPGTYNICVTVTDNNGCTATYCQNDSVYRLANNYNSTSNGMVQVNVLNVNITTGIGQLAATNWEVYPSPASNKVFIKAEKILETKLLDVLGKEIISTQENYIDVSNLQEGIYFVQVKTAASVLTKKIIVQH